MQIDHRLSREGPGAAPFYAGGRRLARIGRGVALAGAAAPLLLIGGMKFTAVEIAALQPLIAGTPWLAWLYPLLGEAGASYLLGVVEMAAGLLLLAAPWSARAGVAGGALGGAHLRRHLLADARPADLGAGLGFPALGPLGQFLIKDIALLGIARDPGRRASAGWPPDKDARDAAREQDRHRLRRRRVDRRADRQGLRP